MSGACRQRRPKILTISPFGAQPETLRGGWGGIVRFPLTRITNRPVVRSCRGRPMSWEHYEQALKTAERSARRTADRVSAQLAKMVFELPRDVTPIAAMELIGDILVERQPQLVVWLYEHLQREDVQARLPVVS